MSKPTFDTVTTTVKNASIRGPLGSRQIADLTQKLSLPVLLVAVILIAAVTTPDFLSIDNLRGILLNTAVIGTAAVAMTVVTLSGNLVSLGVTQQAMLAAVMFIGLQAAAVPTMIALVLTLIVLVIVGAVQGVAVAIGLNPMITTLAVGVIIFGIATIATGGIVVIAPGVDFSWIALGTVFGIPLPVVVFILATVLASIFVHGTPAGRRIVLTGANRATARLSGISLASATVVSFAIFGFGTGLSGILVAAQAGQATTQDLATLTGNVIAAVLVGGTAIQGGFGSPVRSAFGALMIAIFTNTMVLHDVSHGWRTAAVGILVVAMVIILHMLRKKAHS